MVRQSGQAVKKVFSANMSALGLLKGILVAYIITIPTFLIFALILTNVDFPEKFIPTVVNITTIISILTAGSTATKSVANKGWLNGAIVGAVYIIILYLLSSIVFKDFSLNRHIWAMFLMGVAVGSIGGILGINLRKTPRKRL